LPDGASIDAMPIEYFCGKAICIDCQGEPPRDVGVADFSSFDIQPGDIVLCHTGWQQRSGTRAFFDPEWPGLSEEAARYLVDHGVKAVGIDSPSVDSMPCLIAGAPAHRILLGSGLPIFESLVNLDKIYGLDFTFYGMPLKIQGCEASPIRAIAQLL
jgi:kynurenine formamidase